MDNIVLVCISIRVIYIIMFNGGLFINISCKFRFESDFWYWVYLEVFEYLVIFGKVNMKLN